MNIEISKLKKSELVWMATHRCKHHHLYIEHPNCYIEETHSQRKIGILDIETSNLDANFGVIFTGCIKPLDSDPNDIEIYRLEVQDLMYPPEKLDYRLVKELVKAIKRYDIIVTYYGKRFDIPYLRTRAIMLRQEFPEFGTIKHIDVYDWAKKLLRFRGKRMENVERVLFGDSLKTHIEFKHWISAVRLDKESLDYIVDHNVRDVLSLEKVFNELRKYARPVESSI